ncbi:MAG: hypothetical protein K9L69_02425 [Candidatus Omnitrophica bacterium]|nr:hypothetical protein [Candidatus Omnitrophota bacterium]MCF7894975.1 hypothetical protein [Candidatus Omnitrophota bacterium]
MSAQHKELAGGRWAKMPLVEQMANIGSEVSRALNWQKKEKKDLSKKAVNRALELIDLTAFSLKKYSQLKELFRVREILVDFFYGINQFSSSELLWRKYFDHFAYLARKN